MLSCKFVKTLARVTSLASICLLTNAFTGNHLLTLRRDVAPLSRQPKRSGPSSHRTLSEDKIPSTATLLFAEKKLWDRLGLQRIDTPLWYLLNCVAGLEMDLLKQCRETCADMDDALKFIVPTETKTRSHGANRMVSEEKVKYPGYVFAKLRLSKEVYEPIQNLDLCRSWMGTVNQKGFTKLPPKPMPLNELEVENFGLEDEDFEVDPLEGMQDINSDSDIVLDDADDDEEEAELLAKAQERREMLKEFNGLEVEDMVKVTEGKFLDEDGIVRRLKDGKILVRFYTYGSMFEEWMNPDQVRKLSNVEILKGLSGPSRPITQREFDNPGGGRRYDRDFNENRPSSLRRDLMGNVRGERGSRNTRRDRVARGDQNRREIAEERSRNEKNWNWYQDQKREQQRRNDIDKGRRIIDGEWEMIPGSVNGNDDDVLGDVDAQWGRTMSKRTQRRNKDKQQRQSRNNNNNNNDNEDWSAFVSPAPSPAPNPDQSSDADDFFENLMADLSNELGGNKQKKSSSRGIRNGGDMSISNGGSASDSSTTSEEDDFFASLMTEINAETSSSSMDKDTTSNDDDDFFAALADDISMATDGRDERPSGRSRKSSTSDEAKDDDLFGSDDDDFFNSLAQELDGVLVEGGGEDGASTSSSSDESSVDDFFASLESEVESTDGGFFASLESTDEKDIKEDSNYLAPKTQKTAPETKTKDKPALSEKTRDDVSLPERPSSPSMNSKELTKFTVPVLKDMLRERGLKVSGKKSELIERLIQ